VTNVFVFGSNLAGRHGKGAALYAKQHHGAVYGIGVGLQGGTTSGGPSTGYSYAIPTKDHNLKTLPLSEIEVYVHQFLDFALECMTKKPDFIFQLTPIGCGLAGYKPEDIVPLFQSWSIAYGNTDEDNYPCMPYNIILPEEFLNVW
jgi:hypothetical protein